jgi:hypothetical protein
MRKRPPEINGIGPHVFDKISQDFIPALGRAVAMELPQSLHMGGEAQLTVAQAMTSYSAYMISIYWPLPVAESLRWYD